MMQEIEQAEKFLLHIQWIDIVLFIAMIIVLTLMAKLIDYVANFIAKQFPKNRMLVLGWVPIICFATYFIGMFLAIYYIIHPSRDVVLGFLASGLIAIGFAIKDIAASIISGIILLIARPFQLGDRIVFQNVCGDITSIGLSSVTVLTIENGIVTIPNHLFITNFVTSESGGTIEIMKIVDIYVPAEVDLEKVKAVMIEVMQNSPLVDHKKEYAIVAKEVIGTTGFVNIMMRMECMLKNARTEKEFMTYYVIEVNKALKKIGIQKSTS